MISEVKQLDGDHLNRVVSSLEISAAERVDKSQKASSSLRVEAGLRAAEEDNFRVVMQCKGRRIDHSINDYSPFPAISELLSLLVDIDNLEFFVVTIEFAAELALEMGDIDAAAYLFNACLIVFTFTENFLKKAKTLLSLAKCARIKCAYSEAKRLLKKSLQYAWHV